MPLKPSLPRPLSFAFVTTVLGVAAAVAAGVVLAMAVPAVAADGTVVGGVLASDTVWTVEGSPYRVTSTVQVPAGVTLTIQPGVRVISEGAADFSS